MGLSSEQQELLRWLREQPGPVSKSGMQRAAAPGYDDQRIEAMVRDDLLSRTITVENEETAGAYALTDKATAILQAQEQQDNELAKQRDEAAREKRADRRHDFFVAAISAVSLLVVEALIWFMARLWP